MKRFIIAVDRVTPEQINVFTKLLQSSNCGWWHWMANLWLVVDPNDSATAVSWRDKLNALLSSQSARVFVTEIVGALAWAGTVPAKAHGWLQQNWSIKSKLVSDQIPDP